MNAARSGAVAVGVLLLAGGLWMGLRARAPSGPVSLRVQIAATELHVPGDTEGNIRVFYPTDVVRFELRQCGEPGGPLSLWTSPGRPPRWTAVAVDPAWAADEACQKATVEMPASALWPGMARGVARWTWVAGPGSDQLADPISPEAAWRRAPAMADGEVVLREAP